VLLIFLAMRLPIAPVWISSSPHLAGPTGVVSPLNLQLDGFGEALFFVEGNAVGQSFYTVSTAATPKVSTVYIINTVADNASRLVIDYDGPTRLIAGDAYALTVRATDASGNTDLSWTDPIFARR
jgi:hypothetical protein